MSAIKSGGNGGRTVIGIDVGGSTTKIVGFTSDGTLVFPMLVKANESIGHAYEFLQDIEPLDLSIEDL